jgi:hypothetical protein
LKTIGSGGGKKRASTLSQEGNDLTEMEEGEIQGEITTIGAAGAGVLVRRSDMTKTMQTFGLSVDSETIDRARMLSNAMKQLNGSGGGNNAGSASMSYPYPPSYYAPPQGASPFMMPSQNGGGHSPYMMPQNMNPASQGGFSNPYAYFNPYFQQQVHQQPQQQQQGQGGGGQQAFNAFYPYPPSYPPGYHHPQ